MLPLQNQLLKQLNPVFGFLYVFAKQLFCFAKNILSQNKILHFSQIILSNYFLHYFKIFLSLDKINRMSVCPSMCVAKELTNRWTYMIEVQRLHDSHLERGFSNDLEMFITILGSVPPPFQEKSPLKSPQRIYFLLAFSNLI